MEIKKNTQKKNRHRSKKKGSKRLNNCEKFKKSKKKKVMFGKNYHQFA